jgi:hypothetical protein
MFRDENITKIAHFSIYKLCPKAKKLDGANFVQPKFMDFELH